MGDDAKITGIRDRHGEPKTIGEGGVGGQCPSMDIRTRKSLAIWPE
jgi:hypothetical protein